MANVPNYIQIHSVIGKTMFKSKQTKEIAEGLWLSPHFYFGYFNLKHIIERLEPEHPLLKPITSDVRYFSAVAKDELLSLDHNALHRVFPSDLLISFDDFYNKVEIETTHLLLYVLAEYGESYRYQKYVLTGRSSQSSRRSAYVPVEMAGLFDSLRMGRNYLNDLNKMRPFRFKESELTCRSGFASIRNLRTDTDNFDFVEALGSIVRSGAIAAPGKEPRGPLSMSDRALSSGIHTVEELLQRFVTKKKEFFDYYEGLVVTERTVQHIEANIGNKAKKEMQNFFKKNFHFIQKQCFVTTDRYYFLTVFSRKAQLMSISTMLEAGEAIESCYSESYGWLNFSRGDEMVISGPPDTMLFTGVLPDDEPEIIEEEPEEELIEEEELLPEEEHNAANHIKVVAVVAEEAELPKTHQEQLSLFTT